MKRPIKIGVVGPHACSRQDQALGFAVGAEIARRGGILICADNPAEAVETAFRKASAPTRM